MFLKQHAIPKKLLPIDTQLYPKETFTLEEKFAFNEPETEYRSNLLSIIMRKSDYYTTLITLYS